jgi:predicted nucleotidyltransferase
MNLMYGLLERDIEYLIKAFTNFKEVERAIIFGSRAIGNYKKGSDVDIALIGKEISKKTLYDLYELLNEEYPLPYFFDLLNYDELNNQELIEHIDAVGKELYRK